MKMWIAREKGGLLEIFTEKPHLHQEDMFKYWVGGRYFVLPYEAFPDVTFENSPKEVEIKIKEEQD